MDPHFSFPKDAYVDLLKKIESIISLLPDVDENHEIITCHAVCRSLSHCLPGLRTIDGYFGSLSHHHSWLVIDNDPKIIIDPYPWVCIGGPIIVDFTTLSPWKDLYRQAALPHEVVTAGVNYCIEYLISYFN